MSEPGEPNKGVASNTVSLDDNRETEENITGGRNSLDFMHVDTPNHAADDADDNELEDSEDEVNHSEPSSSVVNRRRMVLDVEDYD